MTGLITRKLTTLKNSLPIEDDRLRAMDELVRMELGEKDDEPAETVTVEQWRDELFRLGIPRKDQANWRQAFRRVRDWLEREGVIAISGTGAAATVRFVDCVADVKVLEQAEQEAK